MAAGKNLENVESPTLTENNRDYNLKKIIN